MVPSGCIYIYILTKSLRQALSSASFAWLHFCTRILPQFPFREVSNCSKNPIVSRFLDYHRFLDGIFFSTYSYKPWRKWPIIWWHLFAVVLEKMDSPLDSLASLQGSFPNRKVYVLIESDLIRSWLKSSRRTLHEVFKPIFTLRANRIVS